MQQHTPYVRPLDPARKFSLDLLRKYVFLSLNACNNHAIAQNHSA